MWATIRPKAIIPSYGSNGRGQYDVQGMYSGIKYPLILRKSLNRTWLFIIVTPGPLDSAGEQNICLTSIQYKQTIFKGRKTITKLYQEV